MSRVRRIICAVVIYATAASARMVHASSFSILPPLPGHAYASGVYMSSDGSTVVGASFTANEDPYSEAFR